MRNLFRRHRPGLLLGWLSLILAATLLAQKPLQTPRSTMLSSQKLIAFVSTTNADRARAFYRDTLGLRLISEDGFALRFDCGGTALPVTIAPEVIPAKYTVLGWGVEDLKAAVLSLQKAGVQFERFGFFTQDDLGIWTAPNGDQVAWFRDPDGNLLSIGRSAPTP